MAWRDRGLAGELAATLRCPAPAPAVVRRLGRAVAAVDARAALAALGWPDGGRERGVALRALAPDGLLRGRPGAPDDRWLLACDGRRAALVAPGGVQRRADVDLTRALELGGRDLALVFALLGADGRARRRLRRAQVDLERRLARAARGALAAARQALGGRDGASAAAARLAVAEVLGRALTSPAGGPPRGRARRAAWETLAPALPDVRLLGAAALGRVLQDLLRATGARRDQGSWFTPAPLADAVAQLGLRPALARLRSRPDAAGGAPVDALSRLRVVDPACGSGRVLTAALDVLTRAALDLGAGPPPRLADLRRRLLVTLCGVDLDPAAVALARAALAAHARATPAAVDAVVADALARRWSAPVDAVIGNPPWRRERGARGALAAARASRLGEHARARTDLWMLFAHLALDLVRAGGTNAFVAPGYWLRGAGAGPCHLRERLWAVARWRALADLGRLDRFEGGGAGARAVVYAVERLGPQAPARAPALAPSSGSVAGDAGEGDGAAAGIAAWTVGPRAEAGALARALRGGDAPGVSLRRVVVEDARGPRGEVLLERAPRAAARALLATLQGGALPSGWLLSEGLTANPERLTRAHVARGDLPPGARPGEPVFVLPAEVARALPARERRLLLPWLAHDAIDRLRADPAAGGPRLIHATPATLPDLGLAPALARHLARFRAVLEARRETRLGRRAWFHLHWPRDPRVVAGARVLLPRWTRWPSGALVTSPCAVGESAWVLAPPEPAWAPLAAALLASAPLALGLLVVSKRRGKGVDLARAALAACPWPDAATFAAAARIDARRARRAARALGRGEPAADRALALAACGAAAGALALEHAAATRRFEGPWWRHPLAPVRAWGAALDRAACEVVGVALDAVRAAADDALGAGDDASAAAGPAAAPTAAPSTTPVPAAADLLVSREPAWRSTGLGAACLHLELAPRHAADLRALLDPYVEVVDPGVVDPGVVDPGVVDPGVVDPGVVDPGRDLLLLRLCPSVDAPTLAALLRRAGWRVERGVEEERVWTATPRP